ncbi:unnamed protein product [Parnassius mnemosyne]|uniref:BPTI/Kunitz inhibitor domain-containing protein n=1 Tax=Parnassius mnemosyne TaxID=213953 RepID=A0AAV1K905_9NEOP
MKTIYYILLCSFGLLPIIGARMHDYVRDGRDDLGPFPSNLMNVPYYCYQVPSKGPCGKMYKSWFFDIVRRKCMPMFYSGCGGNENRFNSETLCMISCGRMRTI